MPETGTEKRIEWHELCHAKLAKNLLTRSRWTRDDISSFQSPLAGWRSSGISAKTTFSGRNDRQCSRNGSGTSEYVRKLKREHQEHAESP
jgi:hypothetical protein